MKKEEANKVIAKFMGRENYIPSNLNEMTNEQKLKYMEYISLDVLVLVWEKLSIYGAWLNINRHGLDHYQVAFINKQNPDIEKENTFDATSEDIQQAAAIATAKAILQLESEVAK
jgi:hypothetical protein